MSLRVAMCLSMLVAAGCSDSPAGGGNDAAGGSGGGFSGGMFMIVAPCNSATMYMETTTLTFPDPVTALGYLPSKCAKVHKGASVTFSGTFTDHPLLPGAGGTTPNPIALTETGTTATFTFPDLGFFPFYCRTHGQSLMSGVVWVD